MSAPASAVRPRTDADLPALVEALRRTHLANAYPSGWPDDPAGFLAPPAPLGAWVAQVGGVAVGQVVLRPAPPEGEPLPAWIAASGVPRAEVAVVSRLFVAPGFQGRGLARSLFRTAWAEARSLGRRAILDVHTASAVPIALYESEAWRQVATLAAPWTEADGRVPQVHVYVSPA
ncbi:GNAT family N-acetyltransferase [Deinococcus aerophilus]|uniref:GNAT family N-acetyltransferase n=1 Tax=Deinococcus aerophilus TaxID=522488 RepID=A0ABQ2GIC1_9DEIO|nr:GNAT family N-acetyltransferase [Deinococcus aerophilus]GGL97600.1 GNAT family N-acetyltransferase [Deinococcus aerophilus]